MTLAGHQSSLAVKDGLRSGIGYGLQVRPVVTEDTEGMVAIEPGWAVDDGGNVAVLPGRRLVQLSVEPGASRQRPQVVYLLLRFPNEGGAPRPGSRARIYADTSVEATRSPAGRGWVELARVQVHTRGPLVFNLPVDPRSPGANEIDTRYRYPDLRVESSYLEYLPAIFRHDPFLGRFLRIFEDILTPIERIVDTLPARFDPRLAPDPLPDVLAEWLGVRRPPGMPGDRWREFLSHATELDRWRGTRRGLGLALQLATGCAPTIVEHDRIPDREPLVLRERGSSVLRDDSATASVLAGADLTFSFEGNDAKEVDVRLADAIIAAYKPVYLSHDIRLRP